MKFRPRPNWLVQLILVLSLALTHYGTAELGRFLIFTPEAIAPIWVPDGIALAALLLWGYRVCPGIFIGAWLAHLSPLMPSALTGAPTLALLTAGSIAGGTTLGLVLTSHLLKTFVGRQNPFNHPRDTVKFLTLSSLLAPLVHTTVWVTALTIAGHHPGSLYGRIWLMTWMANVTGILIITPALLVWHRWFSFFYRMLLRRQRRLRSPQLRARLSARRQYRRRSSSDRRWQPIWKGMEAVVLVTLVGLTGAIALLGGYPVEYLLIPLLVWAAFRFGQRGATLMIWLVSGIAIWGTVNGMGTFGQQSSAIASLLLLESFLAVAVLTSLVLTAVITSRYRAMQTLSHSERQLLEQKRRLERALTDLRQTQAKLVQTEKISSLGQLVAGVAHEVNNPVSFIAGNLNHIRNYTQDLIEILELYQQTHTNPSSTIQQKAEEIDLDYVLTDLPKALDSMQVGTDRICDIISSLRNFSRSDSAQKQPANLHTGLDSTILILQHRLKANSYRPAIHLKKQYGDLPLVECYAGQMNQVFMNLIANAIDALDDYSETLAYSDIEAEPNVIEVRTEAIDSEWVTIAIYNNGPSIPDHVQERLFDAFYTTKPMGKGTGLGLSISQQIVVEKHQGQLKCVSRLGWGTEFLIRIPVVAARMSRSTLA